MKKRILVTDDDPGVQDIFKIIFEKAGYEVVIVHNPKEILENKFEHPNIFLLDKQLSGVDGLDVCRHLKTQNETKHIPVIMVSATPGLDTLSRQAGADDFLEKPFNMRNLLALVARHVGT